MDKLTFKLCNKIFSNKQRENTIKHINPTSDLLTLLESQLSPTSPSSATPPPTSA